MSYYALVESRTKDLDILDSEYILNHSLARRKFNTVGEAMGEARKVATERIRDGIDLVIIHVRDSSEVDRRIYTTPVSAIEIRKGEQI